MTSSLIVPVFGFRRLAQIDSAAASHRASAELFGLALVALIVFVALTGFLVWRLRATKPTRAHRDRRPLVPSAWGLARGIDPDTASGDSVRRPPGSRRQRVNHDTTVPRPSSRRVRGAGRLCPDHDRRVVADRLDPLAALASARPGAELDAHLLLDLWEHRVLQARRRLHRLADPGPSHPESASEGLAPVEVVNAAGRWHGARMS